MKESFPEWWYVIYRETKVSPLKVMKVKGLKQQVLKAVRNQGYSVSLAFNFDKLLAVQNYTQSEFIKHYQNYSNEYYFHFIKHIDLWEKHPKYQLNNIPLNSRRVEWKW